MENWKNMYVQSIGQQSVNLKYALIIESVAFVIILQINENICAYVYGKIKKKNLKKKLTP